MHLTMSVNGVLTSFQELEKLSQKFSENVLDATKKFEKLITDKKEIDGLPATALGLAAQTAVSKVWAVNTGIVSENLFPLLVLVLTINIARVMKMLQLKMDLGSSHWTHQVISLLCNTLATGLSVKKSIVLI